MLIETIEAETRPMLYVSRSASMDPNEIAAAMEEAFGAMGAFLGRSGVTPAGPPLAVYRDWDEATGRMTIELGFPVASCDTTKAKGEVHAGQTPAGKALKAVHRGPYPGLHESWEALEAHMKTRNIPIPPFAWEVYVGDPDNTPEDELRTELYMPLV